MMLSAVCLATLVIRVPVPSPDADAVGELERVRDRIRALAPAERAAGVRVELASGEWKFRRQFDLEPADSGEKGAEIVWSGAADGRTVFAFSEEIPRSAFGPVTDPAVTRRLDPSVVREVLVADVSRLRLAAPAREQDVLNAALEIPELYCRGERMPTARWPDSTDAQSDRPEAWAEVEKILDAKGIFTYVGDRPARWAKADDAWLQGYWAVDWAVSTIPLASVDTTNRTLRLKYPHAHGLKAGNPSPRRWRALHVLEELDRPGEYWIDFRGGKLYFLPPGPFDAVRVASRDARFVMMHGVHDVAFCRIAFRESFGSGVHGEGVRRVRLEDLSFRNLRTYAVGVFGAEDCVLRRCDAEEMGGGGHLVYGGDRRTLTPGGNVADDCRVRGFSRLQLCYSPAMSVGGVGNSVLHCEFSDSPHMAIACGGNDCLFAYNVISNVVTSSDDTGAFYKGRNPSMRGNVLRCNLWRDIGTDRGHGTTAVYFDDGSLGDVVEESVFIRCGHPGRGGFGAVFSHGGHSNVVRNCVFADCPRAFGSWPWGDDEWREFVNSPLSRTHLHDEVDITKAPYVTHYPDFADFMAARAGYPRDNLAVTNVLVGCAEVKSGRFVTNATDVAIAADGFPRTGSPVAQARRLVDRAQAALPGFRPIPVERIGLRTPRSDFENNRNK